MNTIKLTVLSNSWCVCVFDDKQQWCMTKGFIFTAVQKNDQSPHTNRNCKTVLKRKED